MWSVVNSEDVSMLRVLSIILISLGLVACGSSGKKAERRSKVAINQNATNTSEAGLNVALADGGDAYESCVDLGYWLGYVAVSTNDGSPLYGMRLCMHNTNKNAFRIKNMSGNSGRVCVYPFAKSNNGYTVDFFTSEPNPEKCIDINQAGTNFSMSHSRDQFNGVIVILESNSSEFNNARTQGGTYTNYYADGMIGGIF